MEQDESSKTVKPTPIPVLVPDVDVILSLITSAKTAMQHAYEKRRTYWQDCEELLWVSLQECEACESSLLGDFDDSEGLVKRLWHLGGTLEECYESTGDTEILSGAIAVDRASLSACSPEHSHRARSCLVGLLHISYSKTGNEKVLTEAIELEREALALQPRGHPNRVGSCANLAASLGMLYESTGKDQLLTEGIALDREALDLCPPEHPDRAYPCDNLASLLQTRYMRTGDDQLLTEAIGFGREALALRPRGHPDRALSCANLATSLGTQYMYISIGDGELITEVLNLNREALALRPTGHPDRARSCANLAGSLQMRYNSTGDDLLLSEVIELEREALNLRPPGHPDRAYSCASLADSLRIWHSSTGDNSFLLEAVDLERESLALRPPGHPDRANSCANLAGSLQMRYNSTGDDQLLTETIELKRESLALRTQGHPDRAKLCASLATSLQQYYIKTPSSALINEINDLCTEGFSLSTPQTKWCHAASLVWLVLQCDTKSQHTLSAIRCLSQCFESDPDDVYQAVDIALYCLDILWTYHSNTWDECNKALITIYSGIIKLLPFLINPIVSIASQLQGLRDCTRLASDAFVNAALAGQWESGVEDLEVIQGLCWSQYHHFRDPQLDDIPPELAAKLQQYLNAAIASGGPDKHSTFSTLRDAQHDSVSQVYALLREIRSLPGLDRFMLGETFDTLRSVATADPVVVLVGGRGHFYALVLRREHVGCALIQLAIREDELQAISSRGQNAQSQRGPTSASEKPLEWEEDLERGARKTASCPTTRLMRYLWLNIVKPVVDEIRNETSPKGVRPRLHWYPTGAFASLPLHAAGIYDGPKDSRTCCADYVVSSYTPTLTTLLRAQSASKPLRRDACHLTLCAEKKASEKHLRVLREVDVEVSSVALIATSRLVKTVQRLPSPVTISETGAAMQNANIIHLACHGIQDLKSAAESGFCLSDGRLTISELMKMTLDHPFLAFLSACETAKGDHNQPDQVMHLAAAMMFLGFKTVVATMWAIVDEDGPKVAEWFYEELFSHEVIDGDAVAYALDMAVRKLRGSGVSIERWAPFIQMGI